VPRDGDSGVGARATEDTADSGVGARATEETGSGVGARTGGSGGLFFKACFFSASSAFDNILFAKAQGSSGTLGGAALAFDGIDCGEVESIDMALAPDGVETTGKKAEAEAEAALDGAGDVS